MKKKAPKKGSKPAPKLVKPTGERKLPKTDIQMFLEEEKQRQAKKQEMIDALLAERDEKMKEYDDQLKLLGYNPSPLPKFSAERKAQRQRDPNKPCPICNVAGHDARAHRSQNPKRPFTQEELARFQ